METNNLPMPPKAPKDLKEAKKLYYQSSKRNKFKNYYFVMWREFCRIECENKDNISDLSQLLFDCPHDDPIEKTIFDKIKNIIISDNLEISA